MFNVQRNNACVEIQKMVDDQPYYKWVEQTQSHAGEKIIPETDNHIEETERPEVTEENLLGISILFIDLDGDVR